MKGSSFWVICAALSLAAAVMPDARAAGRDDGRTVDAKVNKVVIDMGHGGKDPGCVSGKNYEKDVTLGIGLKLGDYIKTNFPEVEVIYTRTTDRYVELVDRGKIANNAGADLFISIHINSATTSSARGTSTYVMGMDKTNKNLEVAMRENDVVTYEEDYSTKYEGYNPGDPASYIMFSLMQYAYRDQSIMFAELVQKHFKQDLPMPDRGTREAPFLVLWRTSMPSVLTEVGFMSNATDRAYITTEKGQREAARSLFNAFSEYKSLVEGRTNVVVLREDAADDAPEAREAGTSGREGAASVSSAAAADNGVKFYVQLCFVASRQRASDPMFGSYRNKVVEMHVPGRGYRYVVGGTSDYNSILALQREVRREFPDAFVIAFDDGRQISVDKARGKAGK